MANFQSKYTGPEIDEAVGKALGFDLDGDGIVDDANKLGGKTPEEYANFEDFNAFTSEITEEFNTFKEEVEESLATAGGGTSTKVVEGITVLSTGWVDETETTAFWRYRIENANITADMIVDVRFLVGDETEEMPSSHVRATNAGLTATTTSRAGSVDIYAISQPDTDLACVLTLTDFKVV